MKWSPKQQTVFDFVQHGTGNALIEAVAGSGKTTTIVEALKHTCGSTLFLAFNKAIAEELKKRGVNARTFHSLTYGPVTRHLGVRNVESNKNYYVMETVMSAAQLKLYGSFVNKLVSLAKQSGIDAIVPDDYSEWRHIVDHHDLTIESDNADIEDGIALAREVLKYGNVSNMGDFDDLLYLAVREGLSLSKYDWVFVDEAQDTNAIQRALLRKVLSPGGRLIAVGDPAQAIYGFRGSDSNSLDLIGEEFECERLPLTVSYRCPKKIVEHAHRWMQHIEPHEDAPEGRVESVSRWQTDDFKPGDMIVCRNVKPLVKVAYTMLKKRKTAPYFLGRDIGKGLTALINKMKAKGIEQLLVKLEAWYNREYEKAIAAKKDAHAEALTDKYEAICVLIEGLDENHRTVPELVRVIDEMFAEKTNAAIICTIHKSKGLESDRVWWLNSSRMPSPYAKLDWQKKQEDNLCYVATTRAKSELFLIED